MYALKSIDFTLLNELWIPFLQQMNRSHNKGHKKATVHVAFYEVQYLYWQYTLMHFIQAQLLKLHGVHIGYLKISKNVIPNLWPRGTSHGPCLETPGPVLSCLKQRQY